jgi:hypothetical protein
LLTVTVEVVVGTTGVETVEVEAGFPASKCDFMASTLLPEVKDRCAGDDGDDDLAGDAPVGCFCSKREILSEMGFLPT